MQIMQWTGYFYRFYSNKRIETIFDGFNNLLVNDFNF